MTTLKTGRCLVGNQNNDGLSISEDNGNLESLYTILVEGNIASGKTTFVDLFKQYLQVETVTWESYI